MIALASRWRVAETPAAERVAALTKALRLPPVLARLLVQRGFEAPDDARAFLKPSLETLSDPFALRDMDIAVRLVHDAVRAGQAILVHGDYDVDGQCGTTLLTRVLRAAGATAVPFVPHRMRDGYDFGPAGIAAARAAKAGLIITCDCGVTALDAVGDARAAGFKVIVTDHHLPRELPPADAVLNPQRPDCDSPSKVLCGTGVAFKLAQALVAELGLPRNLPFHLLDLVALATVADIVPLTGENRTLVRFGLKLLQDSRWPGVRALVESAGFRGKVVRSGHVGYVIAPRLNAAGRVGEAMDGVRLLLSDDHAEARGLAARLESLNHERQALDQQFLDEAAETVETTANLDQDYGLVLAKEGWHPGVIGIVASRIVERYARPAILLAIEGREARGSGRSIPGFNLHGALARCAELLTKFGGHKMAAGLTLPTGRIAEFREAFNAVAREELTPEDLIPTQYVDQVVSLGELDLDLERLLRRLEPYGSGNPTPVFGTSAVTVRDPRVIKEKHLKFRLADESGRLEAIGFDWADRVDPAWWEAPVDVAFRLEQNQWGGAPDLQARIVQIKPAA